jgi:hypothetical protein
MAQESWCLGSEGDFVQYLELQKKEVFGLSQEKRSVIDRFD